MSSVWRDRNGNPRSVWAYLFVGGVVIACVAALLAVVFGIMAGALWLANHA